MSVLDDFEANNADYAASFDQGHLPLPPARKVAVLACMDARLHPTAALGINLGDAHVIRNAGGIASEAAIRSLTISQRLLDTESIVLLHHTDCGMVTFTDDEVKATILADTGIRPPFALEAFADADEDVRQSIARIKASPFIPTRTTSAATCTRSKPAASAASTLPNHPASNARWPARLATARRKAEERWVGRRSCSASPQGSLSRW